MTFRIAVSLGFLIGIFPPLTSVLADDSSWIYFGSNRDKEVTIARLSGISEAKSVRYLDVGLWLSVKEEFKGISLSLNHEVSGESGTSSGLQIGGRNHIGNGDYNVQVGFANSSVGGTVLQLPGINHASNPEDRGAQIGLWNELDLGSQTNWTGGQIGLVNRLDGDTELALQVGLWNSGKALSTWNGVQVGLVNNGRYQKGVRLGLWNTHEQLAGFSFGVGNVSTRTLSALEVGVFASNSRSESSASIAAIHCSGTMDSSTVIGAFNKATQLRDSCQIGLLNIADQVTSATAASCPVDCLSGSLQLGVINIARKASDSTQIGIINSIDHAKTSLQVGLVNLRLNAKGTWIVRPIITHTF